MPGPTPRDTHRRPVPFVDGEEALAAASGSTDDDPVLLIPPPGAAGYLGLGWFQSLTAELPASADVLVDCGADPALAFEALRLGFTHVAFTGDEKYIEELVAFTAQQGAVLYRTPPA